MKNLFFLVFVLVGLQVNSQIVAKDGSLVPPTKLSVTTLANNDSLNVSTESDKKIKAISYGTFVGLLPLGLITQEEGTALNTRATTYNFVGAGVTATGTGSTKTITIPATAITVQDEGANLSTAASVLNFTGTGVTASGTGSTKTINITGGGGGGSLTIQDEGTNLTTSASTLNFTGGGVTASGTGATKVINVPENTTELTRAEYEALTDAQKNDSEKWYEISDEAPTSFVGAGITVQEEGTDLTTTGTTVNFVGSSITATGTGTTKTVTITAEQNVQSDWNQTTTTADDFIENKPTTITTAQANAIAANTLKETNATHTGDVTGSTALTIANNAVTTAKINDGAVTLAKQANLSANVIVGRLGSAGVPQSLTAAQARTILNVADGATAAPTKVDIDALNVDAGTLNGVADTGFFRHRGNIGVSSDDLDEGVYRNSSNGSSQPIDNNAGALIHFIGSDSNFKSQIFQYSGNGDIYVRGKFGAGNNWSSWRQVWHEGNDGSGSGLDADLVRGQAPLTQTTGTFTPSISTSGTLSVTYTTQTGTYVKTGRVVHFSLYIRIDAASGSGSTNVVEVSGLPFTLSGTNNVAVNVGNYSMYRNATSSGNTFVAHILQSNNRIRFFAGVTTVKDSNFNTIDTTRELLISGSYETNQ